MLRVGLFLVLALPALAGEAGRECPFCGAAMELREADPIATAYRCPDCDCFLKVYPDGSESGHVYRDGQRRLFARNVSADAARPAPSTNGLVTGHPLGRPGQPVDRPGHPVSRPGHPVSRPGPAVSLPSHPVDRPGHAVDLPGQAVDRPGQAVGLPSHPVDLPGHAVSRPGQAVSRPGHPVLRGGHPILPGRVGVVRSGDSEPWLRSKQTFVPAREYKPARRCYAPARRYGERRRR